MVTALALAAAVCFALGNVLQQRGTLETAAGADDPRFLVQVFRRPVWLLGGLSQATGWVLQAVALAHGPLALVQSLTMLSLVFALPLGARLTGQRITRPVVVGAAAVIAGIVVFIVVGAPSSGGSTPSGSAAAACVVVTVLAIAAFALLARHRLGAMRATLLGTAAGFAFGLQGAATKVFTGVVDDGFAAVLSSWSTWALVLSALVGFAFQQGGLKTGVLAPAMASSNAVTLFAGVILGIAVFDERLRAGIGAHVVALAGIAAALWGVVLLAARSQPPAGAPEPEEGVVGG